MTLSETCKRILLKEPFYGYILMSLNKTFSDKVERACCSIKGLSYEILINELFWEDLDDEQQVMVLKHELLHLCFSHLLYFSEYADKNLYNIATDAEINQYLDLEVLSSVPGGAIDIFKMCPGIEPKAGTKYYYDYLSNNGYSTEYMDPYSSAFAVSDPGGGGGGGNLQHKDHSMWDVCTEEFEDCSGLSDVQKGLIRDQFDYILVEAFKNSPNSRGTMPGNLEEYIKKLMEEKPSVFNWKAYVRRLLGTSREFFTKPSRMRQSKRFEDAMGHRLKMKAHLLVAVDTSGSVSSKELADFFTEIQHVWKSGVAVDIVECDSRIHNVIEYKGKFDGKVHGRGGTSFSPAAHYFNTHRRKYSALVYFTDGYAPIDFTLNGPSVWIITSDGNHQDYPGKTVYIPKENE